LADYLDFIKHFENCGCMSVYQGQVFGFWEPRVYESPKDLPARSTNPSGSICVSNNLLNTGPLLTHMVSWLRDSMSLNSICFQAAY
jgi:hypothetical protein